MLAHSGLILPDAILHLPGPVFLILLGGGLVASLVAGRLLVLWSMRSGLPRLKVPSPIDPYSIAFLRGGDAEVLRTAMVELVEGGWIVQDTSLSGWKKWATAKTPKWRTDYQGRQPSSLGELQRLLLRHFEVAKPAHSVFERLIMAKVRSINEPYRRWVYHEHLWNPPKKDFTVTLWLFGSCIVLEAIALDKLFHAMSEHRNNVGFLMGSLLLIPVLFFLVSLHTRLSDLGKKYLQDVQAACLSVRKLQHAAIQPRPGASSYSSRDSVSGLAGDVSLSLLGMGVWGVSALQGSPLDPLYLSYQRSANSSSGCGTAGCGSSCGGSSGCGGGSGGGGGSCGGGGCGGCGGG